MFVCDFHYGLAGVQINQLVWSSLWSRSGTRGIWNGEMLTWESRFKRALCGVRCMFGMALSPLATRLIESTRARRRKRLGIQPGV